MKARRRTMLQFLFALLIGLAVSPVPVHSAGIFFGEQAIENQSTGIEIHPEELKFERIALPGGLSSKIIQSIAQDQQGFIWVGTEGGLYKYDGYEFSLYQQDTSDSNPLTNDIETIFIDSNNKIWVGMSNGLFRFDRATGSFEKFHDEYVYTIYEDSQGTIWVSASDDMYQFDVEKGELVRWAFANYGLVFDIHETRDGALWLGTTEGLIRYQSEKPGGKNITQFQHSSQNPNSISDNVIISIVEDLDGNLWLGTANNGVNRLSLTDQEKISFEHFTYNPDDPNSLNNNVVISMVTDQSGNLWVGTMNGLNLYDPDQKGFVHFDSGEFDQFFSGIILDLFIDHSGLLWVGSIGALDKLDITAHRFIPLSNPVIQEQVILAAFLDKNGDQWFGTFAEGLYQFLPNGTLYQHYLHDPDDPTSLNNNSVQAIYRDSQDILWIGTENGLNIFNPQTENFTQDPRFTGHQITTIFEDSTGRLWIGTSVGVFNSLRTIRRFSKLRNEYTIDIEDAEDGNVWIGTINGLYLVNPAGQSIAHYSHKTQQSLANDWVNEIYKDANGTLWIGTGEGGFDRFDAATKTFTHYTEVDGLISDTVYCILGDGKGNLWIGTDHGVTKFNKSTESFHNYDSKDGLSSNEVIGCFQNERGEIGFAGLQGLSLLRPGDIFNNLHLPPIVITTFKKFNQTARSDLADDEVIQLSHDDNFVSFEFAALDYVHPEKNQYAYKMEGLDKDWVYAKTRRFADYPDLKPGEYTFRVIGSNNDGIWNKTGTALHIIVTPPIWQTWWFWSLIGLGLVGTVYGGYRLRIRSYKIRSHELEEQVITRTGEINKRRQEIEALYRADEELHRNLEVDQVLHALVDTALEILQADKGTLMVWDDIREKLNVRVSRGISPETLELLTFAPEQGIAGQVGTTGKPAIVEDTATNPKVTRQIVEKEDIRSFIQVPITIDEEIFGVFSADFTQPHQFTKEEERLLVSLAQRAALAIENARLFEQAQELGILKERNRLARDLHDSVTQSMYSVTMYADAASKQLTGGQPDVAAHNLNKLRNVVKEALQDLRLLIFELRPQILQNEGLVAAIEARLDAVENRSGVQIDFIVEGQSSLPFYLEDGFYRIALEALTNTLKHAQAENIQIKLQFDHTATVLEIRDNGIGFDPTNIHEHGGMGIPVMMERAKEIGAQFSIESKPGKGTKVIAKFETNNADVSS